jgi:hypothetical protein
MLEARFHPEGKARAGFVVLGRVVCHSDHVTIEHIDVAPRAVRPFDTSRLHDKLEDLVLSAVADPFGALQKLRSGFWSFVAVPETP